eukprot:scaffold84277_cov57-Phaeocystis_antarctica.AAC.5
MPRWGEANGCRCELYAPRPPHLQQLQPLHLLSRGAPLLEDRRRAHRRAPRAGIDPRPLAESDGGGGGRVRGILGYLAISSGRDPRAPAAGEGGMAAGRSTSVMRTGRGGSGSSKAMRLRGEGAVARLRR